MPSGRWASRHPKVGLLSNGEEEIKGNELVRETFPLLKASNLHFIGMVEGNDIPAGTADVVITDGFTGNVAIKTAEGVGSLVSSHPARRTDAATC